MDDAMVVDKVVVVSVVGETLLQRGRDGFPTHSIDISLAAVAFLVVADLPLAFVNVVVVDVVEIDETAVDRTNNLFKPHV